MSVLEYTFHFSALHIPTNEVIHTYIYVSFIHTFIYKCKSYTHFTYDLHFHAYNVNGTQCVGFIMTHAPPPLTYDPNTHAHTCMEFTLHV